ncbi:MAG TPA: sigma-70 family RNA polymerase sigma factor [Pyrinomonadaceae bacterium]|jgi:RNA polymerase sigma-70 factor (ECF subfamily)
MEYVENFPAYTEAADEREETPAESDYELAQRAAAGDMHAFEQLYVKYNRRVFGLCLRMMQSHAEAEDLTQEIFITLFAKLGSFRGEAAFATWLHRLTINHVLMHFRKGRVRRERVTEDGETPVRIVSGTANPDRMAILDRLALDSAIAQLPPGYRLVFILHEVEGREHHEIAELLGCSIGTSKSQLHKARMKLRRLLRSDRKRKHNQPSL